MKYLNRSALLVSLLMSCFSTLASGDLDCRKVTTESELEQCLDKAKFGEIVSVEGKVTITSDINIKNGVTLRGNNISSSLEADAGRQLWVQNKDIPAIKVAITSINLEGVGVYLKGNKSKGKANTGNGLSVTDVWQTNKVTHVNFIAKGTLEDRAKFGTFDSDYETPQVFTLDLDGVVIDNNTFERKNRESTGIGFLAINSNNGIIINNTFNGYFKTAINGDSVHYWTINNNTINKSKVNMAERLSREDHGIYLGRFTDVTIKKNKVKGYTATSTGMSIKLRDGEGGIIDGNTFEDSGVLLAHYNIKDYEMFSSIRVVNNKFLINENSTDNEFGDPYQQLAGCNRKAKYGILYDHDHYNARESGFDIDILISGNKMYNTSGGISGAIHLTAAGPYPNDTANYSLDGKDADVMLINNTVACIHANRLEEAN